MDIVSHKHSPVLRGIWTLVNLLSDHLAQSGLLSKPFARWPGDGVPTQFHSARLSLNADFVWWNDIWRLAQSQLVLNE